MADSSPLTVERVPLATLKPASWNAMTHPEPNIKAIKDSLTTFGQAEPLVCRLATREIIGGNGRSEAMLSLGWSEADVVFLDVDEPTAKALSLALNRTAQTAVWDPERLAAQLAELKLAEFDVSKLGWDGKEIDELLAPKGGEVVDSEPQIDRADELRKQWGVESGQLWVIPSKTVPGKSHRILCGDSTKPADVARVMGGEKAAIVSDPPYGINVDTSWLSVLHVKHGKPANKSDDKLQGDDGTLDLSWVYQCPEWLVFGFPFVARTEAFTGLLVWDKRGDGGEKGLGNPVEVAASNAFNGYRLSRHVWAGYVREAGEHREPHPTQKPVGILVDAIGLVKAPIVFDPFLGSGTTLVACENLGRIGCGIEINPGYCAVVLERMKPLGLSPYLVEKPSGENVGSNVARPT